MSACASWLSQQIHQSKDLCGSARRWDRFRHAASAWSRARGDLYEGAFVRGAIGPEGPPRMPIRPQAFVVCNSVLDDERFGSLRMGQAQAKTHRATVILHVKRIAREPKRFGEVIHDLGVVVERLRDFLRVRPVAVCEAGLIARVVCHQS
jgi:hypothetical protein